jgi:A/G-specific adenine glycosylase
VHLFDPGFGNKVRVFQEAVVEWYRSHGDRSLPWRATRDPWAVLVAAFLLRKTTTGQVVRVYEELLKRYPSPRALLSAGEDEVRRLIQPLGIEHQRARHLKELAEHVERRFGGRIPCGKDELKKLPGVGDYIASEVLLAACGKPEPLLDRNMIRVLERVFSVRSARSRPHTDPQLWAFARTLVPRDPELAREFNYGVLDLARKVCTARDPKCAECPLTSICNYYSKLNITHRASGFRRS